MTTYEHWDIAIASIAALINLGALAFVALQVRHAVAATKSANEDRLNEWAQRRKESTLQFYMGTIERRESYKTVLPPDRDGDAVRTLIQRSESDREIEHAIRVYMNYYEMLATGIESGVLDIGVITDLAGGSLVAAWNHYSPWIAAQRKESDAPALSSKFEKLAQEVARRRTLPYLKLVEAQTEPPL